MSIFKLFRVLVDSFARRQKTSGCLRKNELKTIENADSDELFRHLLICTGDLKLAKILEVFQEFLKV